MHVKRGIRQLALFSKILFQEKIGLFGQVYYTFTSFDYRSLLDQIYIPIKHVRA